MTKEVTPCLRQCPDCGVPCKGTVSRAPHRIHVCPNQHTWTERA